MACKQENSMMNNSLQQENNMMNNGLQTDNIISITAALKCPNCKLKV